MVTKRKASSRLSREAEIQGFEPRGGKHKAITTYEDVADSEDEFHINRDKVMLDDGPDAKRRRKYAEEVAELEPSDNEVLSYSSQSESDDEPAPLKTSKTSKNGVLSDEEEDDEEEEKEEEEGWGTSRKDYYDADTIQTETDALEEEAEAKRIQQKKLQKMTEADFGFDESEWVKSSKEDGEEEDVVTEVLKDVEITPEMGADERLRILRTRYPEFEFLADEFVELQPVLVELQREMEEEKVALGEVSPIVVKTRALAAYVASLTMYFAILSSTAGRAMDPTELRDHPVMESLFQCRTLWAKVKNLKALTPPISQPSESNSEPQEITSKEEDLSGSESDTSLPPTETTSKSRLASINASLADLDALLPTRKSRKLTKQKLTTIKDDTDSDFGEATHLTHNEATSKAARKKTLKFYTSQITQKSQKRMGAGRDAGGDDDLPYRERFRDRQMRLNAEAEARGKVLSASGRGKGKNIELGGEDSGGEAEEGKGARKEEDEYYNLITSNSSAKKAAKASKIQSAKDLAASNALVRVAGDADLDDDAKRAIGYTIEKNKGLAPKRKKDVRNPRVKKRKKFEEKKKKLGSVKAVYKGGEERGGYGGEKTGIKSGLVKSVKL